MGYHSFASGEVLAATNVNTYLMNQAVIVCTSGTRPTSPVAGMTVFETDTNVYSTYNGTTWVTALTLGAWTSWTPVVTQGSGITLTNTRSRYALFGKKVIAEFAVSLTAGGTGTGTPTISLPVNPAVNNVTMVIGNTLVLHASAYSKITPALGTSANTFNFPDWTNVQLASTDALFGTVMYESA